jgi:asparagine synthase (glutamine-hydrolysing)
MTQISTETSESKKAGLRDQQFVGDLLLVFRPGSGGALRGRNSSAPAELLAQQNEWSLYSFPTNSRWKGYPLLNFSFANWQVWVVGEIYGSNNVEQTCWLVKDAIEQENLTSLSGHYLLLGWNSQKREWNVWTNRLATIHAYHTDPKNGAAIGTCFGSVARTAADYDFDESGLLGFFAFGFFPQNRTYYKNVRILRPSTHETFNSSGTLINSRRYWNWSFQPNHQRSYDDTVAEFAKLLRDIMSDFCRTGRIAVPISGGLDSRSTVAAWEAGNNIWSYSYGYSSDSVETKIARQIAATRNIRFDAFTISPYLMDLLPYVSEAVEGFQDITQTRQASVNDQLRNNADYVIAAHWGDVWLDGFGLPEKQTEEQMISHAMKKFRKRGSNWLLENICPSFLRNESYENILIQMIRDELRSLNSIEDADFWLKALKTEQWSFRWTIPSLRAYQLAVFPRLPFYDNRMIDFFNTVPSSFVIKRRLQIDYLKRFAPDLARITWQFYDANLYHYQHFNSWLLPKRVLKKAQRMISRRPVFQRNWEVQFLSESGRKSLRQYLCNGPGFKVEKFVSAQKIDSLLNEFFASPSAETGYTVSMLLTFAAWLENHG